MSLIQQKKYMFLPNYSYLFPLIYQVISYKFSSADVVQNYSSQSNVPVVNRNNGIVEQMG